MYDPIYSEITVGMTYKNSPYMKILNTFIGIVFESGLQQYWETKVRYTIYVLFMCTF